MPILGSLSTDVFDSQMPTGSHYFGTMYGLKEQHERETASSHVHHFLSNKSTHAHWWQHWNSDFQLTSVNQKRLRQLIPVNLQVIQKENLSPVRPTIKGDFTDAVTVEIPGNKVTQCSKVVTAERGKGILQRVVLLTWQFAKGLRIPRLDCWIIVRFLWNWPPKMHAIPLHMIAVWNFIAGALQSFPFCHSAFTYSFCSEWRLKNQDVDTAVSWFWSRYLQRINVSASKWHKTIRTLTTDQNSTLRKLSDLQFLQMCERPEITVGYPSYSVLGQSPEKRNSTKIQYHMQYQQHAVLIHGLLH